MNLILVAALTLQAAQAEVLPTPSGPHATGRIAYHWKDTRDELETSAPGDKREVMAYVFYPASPARGSARAVYQPDADLMAGPYRPTAMTNVAGLRAHSIEGAPVLRGNARFPVVLLSPGGGMKALTYHTLAEDLASHGYVVVAVEHPFNPRAIRTLEGKVLGPLTPEERGWPQPRNAEENQRFYMERVEHMSRDLSFVIDKMAGLDRGPGPLARRLDLSKGVGAMGHSRGGQAAGSVRLLDPRVKGAINLDGAQGPYMFMPLKGEMESGAAPFLWIQKALPAPPTDSQLARNNRTRAWFDSVVKLQLGAWDARLGRISGGALYVTMNRSGIEHIDFSDEPFWDGNMTAATRPGRIQTIVETRAWVRAFFDGTLRGDWSALKQLTARPQSQVTVKQYGKLWP
jgi:pimeloyl-ACP methyl ester carboxylesterase